MHRKLLKKLVDAGHEAYFVGGAVRDLLLGITPNDWDITTSALPHQIEQLFKGDFKKNYVGKSFKVFIVNGIEIATYRRDVYKGLSDKDVEVFIAGSLEEDVMRRDLTINALAMDINNHITDYIGGVNDIKSKTIRFVGDAEDRIFEDPCRILRALRFLTLLGERATMDDEAHMAILLNSSYVYDYVPEERIRTEIMKVMKYKRPSTFFHKLDYFEMLSGIFPSLSSCVGFDGGKYHDEDVFSHSLMTIDALPKNRPLLRIAGLLHDAGKPISWDGENFIAHDKMGAKEIKEELKHLKFSNDEIHYITTMVRYHMRNFGVKTGKSMRRTINLLKENDVSYKDLLLLNIADRHGNMAKKDYTRNEIKKMCITFHKQSKTSTAFSIRDLEISGSEVMGILNIPQGREVGEILEALFEMVTERPEFNDRETLLKLLKIWE